MCIHSFCSNIEVYHNNIYFYFVVNYIERGKTLVEQLWMLLKIKAIEMQFIRFGAI